MMNDPVWLGNYIVPRWEAFLVGVGMGAVVVIVCICVIAIIGAIISWLVNPSSKPGKQ